MEKYENELVSVVVPVYNNEAYLETCVNTLLEQSYHNIEVILIDDGSTDHSAAICDDFAKQDRRVSVLHIPNGGVAHARNIGIQTANGKYCCFVDSDDSVAKDLVAELRTRITETGTKICGLTPYTIYPYQDTKEMTIKSEKAAAALLEMRFPSSIWAYMYDMNLIANETLNPSIHYFEDVEFNLRMILKTEKVSLVNKRLYNYRVNEQGANHQKLNSKRLTCLNVYKEIERLVKQNSLFESAQVFRAYCLLIILVATAKDPESHMKSNYLILQNYSKDMIKDVLGSRRVPLTLKACSILVAFAPKTVCKTLYLLKYREK